MPTPIGPYAHPVAIRPGSEVLAVYPHSLRTRRGCAFIRGLRCPSVFTRGTDEDPPEADRSAHEDERRRAP